MYITVLKIEHKIADKGLKLNFEIPFNEGPTLILICLLYTSDAADES